MEFFSHKKNPQKTPISYDSIMWLFYYPVSIHRRLIHVNSCTDERHSTYNIQAMRSPLLILFHQLACPLWSIYLRQSPHKAFWAKNFFKVSIKGREIFGCLLMSFKHRLAQRRVEAIKRTEQGMCVRKIHAGTL